ncbi:MAG: AMP-binding protein [Microbacterium sp.]|jgi:phenylacetate-CoA ligase|uniref:phenylacetate--CoA ligase family protein n=1 Tax=Microbacterium sp. TaxID=51671 RepID=UPI001ACDAA64|nr:AMP-binding protein [Microbacterium sp.]MBN9155549.1 AMP-binding protein [Microbacterium sp.]
MTDVFDELEVAPWNEVSRLHEQLLQQQLDYVVERSEFYRDRIGALRGQVRSLEDLRYLPFTAKDDVRQSLLAKPPLGLHLAAEPSEVVQIQSSSGTTGMPTFVAATKRDLETWNSMGARVFYANGFRPGDWVMHAYAMGRGFVGGLVNIEHLQHLGCAVIPLGAESGTERLLRAIDHLKPRAMCATPSMVAYLGAAAQDVLGKPASELSIRAISVGGEPGGGIPAIRENMEQLWGADVRDMMGGADFGSTYWAECDEKDGMHLCSQGALHVELIDPDTLDPIPISEGATGEIVYTALRREATPLVRYRMGDIVTVSSLDCRCGRTGFKIKTHGRADDMLIVRGVNVFPAAIKDIVMQYAPDTTGYLKIDLDFDGHSTYEPLRLRVEMGKASVRTPEELGATLEGVLRDQLTVRTVIQIVPEGSIERPGAAKEKLLERVGRP